MISTRTPLRVTLGGGGTDLESYYRHNGGFIFAMALNKHVHINAHRPAFQAGVALHGPEPENAARVADLRHPLLRAALNRYGVEDRFELSSIADIAGGTGLGSSSSFMVGLLGALRALNDQTSDRHSLAEEACSLEISVLNSGIGKQDQYMAAFGGLTTLEIAPDGEVKVSPVEIAKDVEAAFIAHTRIYYTGLRRDAAVVLHDQHAAMASSTHERRQDVSRNLDYIKDLGRLIKQAWIGGDFAGWGEMLDEHWRQKRQMSAKISWPAVDELYDHVKQNFGVVGGKVIGAGGGGFLMLFTPRSGEDLDSYMAAQNMPRLQYAIDRHGMTLVHH